MITILNNKGILICSFFVQLKERLNPPPPPPSPPPPPPSPLSLWHLSLILSAKDVVR